MPDNTAAQVARLREMAEEFAKAIAEVNENESGYKQGCPAHVRLMELKERAVLANAALTAAADALEREAGLVAALLRIKASDNEADADGLIDDTTCCCCDANSADGCDEDCPRAIAAEALDAARGGK